MGTSLAGRSHTASGPQAAAGIDFGGYGEMLGERLAQPSGCAFTPVAHTLRASFTTAHLNIDVGGDTLGYAKLQNGGVRCGWWYCHR